GASNPVAVIFDYDGADAETTAIKASIDLGLLLLENLADTVAVENSAMSRDDLNRLALNILQATRKRITKTEYISCPGCGRTLYDLHTALKDIKKATSHLKGLKIGVMGCIVNGPGEMADADYGYVGAGVGRVSLYKGKECVMKNLPTDEAIPALIELIRRGGDWKDPEE
ncbi:MAG: flavodoxin-dependent (E)-4-hydroxy-3-methylbut-2-enyl-diphosphate synthase, partial [Duncaniella sp.]|nr:flavodoxin-dependent (E)-4-hydroxy-3-methylbut-2-enyl-diphosphate synthase [Duncaniella sp.]